VREVIHRVLNLLKNSEHDIEALKLKLNIPSENVKVLLEWGESNKLWVRDPISQFYRLADTGEVFLENPEHIDELVKNTPIELKEAGKKASPLLKDERLLCRIREVMDKEIVGEYENKLLLFLIFLSKDLGAEYAQACFIMGESSSGKSYLMHKVLSYFPDECVIWLTRSTTHGLEYFCKGKDLTGHILAIEEAPGVEEAQPYVRPIFSERGLKIVTAQALGGNVASQVIEVKGCPVFVTTSCSPIIDEQMSTRVWILSTDESVEQTKRILEFEAKREKYPKQANIGEEKETIRKALKELKPVKVLIPYADFIDFPFNKIRVRRDFPKLLALIKVSAYLHQYQRPRLVLNGEEYVIATFADYNIAYALAGKVFRPTILGLPEGVLKVFDVCKRLSEQSVEITSRTVTESCEYSQKTVQKYLNELVRARLLLRDESQREYRYSLVEAEDGRLKLNLSLMERFGENELEKWLSSIVDGEKGCGVSYGEMKANIYNPLPTIDNSTFKNEEGEGFSKPEKAEDCRFNKSLPSMGELNKTLKSLAKFFGGPIPMEDVVRELKARGFDKPEALIKRLLSEGRVYEARKGFLSVLGDGYD
jgi:predicted transcriptional regulator